MPLFRRIQWATTYPIEGRRGSPGRDRGAPRDASVDVDVDVDVRVGLSLGV